MRQPVATIKDEELELERVKSTTALLLFLGAALIGYWLGAGRGRPEGPRGPEVRNVESRRGVGTSTIESSRTPVSMPAAQAPLPVEGAGPAHVDDRSNWSHFKKRLYGDRITRNSHPAEYPIVIEGLAKEGIMKRLRAGRTDRAARFCGLSNWDEVEEELARLEEQNSEHLPAFEDLANEGLRVARLAEGSYALALEDPMHFEVIDRDQPDARSAFLEARRGMPFGQYRFSHGTSQGDRAFVLHFDSAYFPFLEGELVQLKSQKEAYWELMHPDD